MCPGPSCRFSPWPIAIGWASSMPQLSGIPQSFNLCAFSFMLLPFPPDHGCLAERALVSLSIVFKVICDHRAPSPQFFVEFGNGIHLFSVQVLPLSWSNIGWKTIGIVLDVTVV